MRTERLKQSPPELDALEVAWWNKNSDTIEKVWAHSKEIRTAIRRPYLTRMKTFFREGRKNSDVIKILEIGCGTGWVGRTISDPFTHIVGTDLSPEQIRTAKDLARQDGLDTFTSYSVTNAATFEGDYDGVLIHALLHHLSEDELDSFFKNLKQIKSGTKVFLYEATFVPDASKRGYIFSRIVDVVGKIYLRLSFALIRIFGKRNNKLWTNLNDLIQEAEVNGWELSPKEIPFFKKELQVYLEKNFEVKRHYPVNRLDFTIGQELMLHDLDKPNYLLTSVVIPIARFLDRLFFMTNYESVLGKSGRQYVFGCYELRLR